jgi:ketosteroid isomerase-like protein
MEVRMDDFLTDRFQVRRRLIGAGLAAPLVALAANPVVAFAGSSVNDARERNKAVVRTYIEATDRGDMDKIESIVLPDVKWWIVGRGNFERSMVMAINRRRFSPLVARRSSILGIAAESDRVAVEYETATELNGEPVFLIYHHLFQLREGAIASVREWADDRVKGPHFTVSQAVPPGQAPWPAPLPGEVTGAQTRAVALEFLTPGNPHFLSREMTAANFRWWVNGRGYGDMFDYFAKLLPLMKGGEAPVSNSKGIVGMTVEGERAAVRIATDVIYPTYDYINRFHHVLIVRRGKVIEFREHVDWAASVKAGFPNI